MFPHRSDASSVRDLDMWRWCARESKDVVDVEETMSTANVQRVQN